MTSQHMVFNGINGVTGQYALTLSSHDISLVAQGERLDPAHLAELKSKWRQVSQATFGIKAGSDAKDLAQAGWGVIFAYNADPAIKDALRELLVLRREQTTKTHEHRYKEYTGGEGYRPDDTAHKFLARNGIGPGPADPDKVPYYLLIVGDPETIPFSFQYQLDVQYAVGRIFFDTLEEYAQYARSVVIAETGKVALPRQATFFGVQNSDDPATKLSAGQLVQPLVTDLAQTCPSWQLASLVGAQATKAELSRILGGNDTPAVLFTASHGMVFPNGHIRQLPHQGGLLCGDWPGPLQWQDEIPQDFYFAADDLGDDARLLGLIAFNFACFAGGTPRLDDFAHMTFREPTPIAPHAFVARLPQRMLGHPKGGALAAVGHVDRAWGYSFFWEDAGSQREVFTSTLKQLMDGYPVGLAIEWFGERYAELSTVLSSELEQVKWGRKPDDQQIAAWWTANNDARSYVIFGDPAVRLSVSDAATSVTRPLIEPVVIRQAAGTAEAASNPESSSLLGATTSASDIPTPEGPDTTLAPDPAAAAGSRSARSDNVAASHPAQPQPTAGTDEVVVSFDDAPTVDFGAGHTLDQVSQHVAAALKTILQKTTGALASAANAATTLRVETYVSDNLAAAFDTNSEPTAEAQLRAVSYINIDGDTRVCVPAEDGAISAALWAMHRDTVEQAQAYRTNLLKTTAETASALLAALASRSSRR